MKLVTDYWSLLFFFIRCPPAMQIVLYMLKAWLGSNPFVTSFTRQTAFRSCCCTRAWQFGRSHVGQRTRRALKMALIAAQESSVVHSARALPTDPRGWGNWYSFQKHQVELYFSQDTFLSQANDQRLSELREIQSIVCSFLHQLFIADPNLVKLVHFQVLWIVETYLNNL